MCLVRTWVGGAPSRGRFECVASSLARLSVAGWAAGEGEEGRRKNKEAGVAANYPLENRPRGQNIKKFFVKVGIVDH